MTDRTLLALLVCPVSGGGLVLSDDAGELLSAGARLAYPIRDGIPIMVASEARPLEEAETRKLKGKDRPRRPVR